MGTDILRRDEAPITAGAWNAIDAEARRVLKGHLSARRFVDMEGPFGWDKSAINLGTVDVVQGDGVRGLSWGIRASLPLVEARSDFALSRKELDSIVRGALAPDLAPVEKATRDLAIFEEAAIYKGLEDAGITGMMDASANKPVPLGNSVESFDDAVSSAVETLQLSGINGPYTLVLGTGPYQFLQRSIIQGGLTLVKSVERKIQGAIAWSPALSGGVLFSQRGGDFLLTVGQDISVGYQDYDAEEVRFYLIESFTFQTLEPRAIVTLQV